MQTAELPGVTLRGAMGILYSCRDEEILLEGGAGCIAGDTKLHGYELTVEEMCQRGIRPVVHTIHGIELAGIPFLKGSASIYRVTLEDGRSVDVTSQHLFMSRGGWKRTSYLFARHEIAVSGSRFCEAEEVLPRVGFLPDDDPAHFAYSSWVPIQSIVKISDNTPYYDLRVPFAGHYLAHGIWHHNSGKTIGGMKKLVDACYAYPGSHHLVCRQTRASMTETTLVTLESIIGVEHPEVRRVNRDQRHSYRLNGSEIVCAGLDEPAKAFGSAWGIVMVEEAIEVQLATWELFARASRDPRLRSAGMSPTFPYHQRIAVTNPGPPSHWLNQRATPADNHLRMINSRADYMRLYRYNSGPQNGLMRRLIAVQQDNPTFFNSETGPREIMRKNGEPETVPPWGWSEEGLAYIARLERMSGARKAWMRWGIWKQESGVVFPMYDEDIHVIDDIEPPPDWPQVLALDPGWGKCGIDWITITPDNAIIVYDNIEEGGKYISQWCEEIERRNHDGGRNVLKYFGDPFEMFSSRSQGPSCADKALQGGLRFAPWPPDQGNDFDAGVDAIRAALDATTHNDMTRPRLYVCRRCHGVRQNFQSWSMKKNRFGEVIVGAEAYENGNEHSLDPLRGTIQSGFLQRLRSRLIEDGEWE